LNELPLALDGREARAVNARFAQLYQALVSERWVGTRDAAQEVCIKLLHHFTQGRAPLTRPVHFLRVLLKHMRVDGHRRQAFHSRRSVVDSSAIEHLPDTQSCDEPEGPEHLEGRVAVFVDDYCRRAGSERVAAARQIRAWALLRLERRTPTEVASLLGVSCGRELLYQWCSRGGRHVARLAAEDHEPLRAAAMAEAARLTSRARSSQKNESSMSTVEAG